MFSLNTELIIIQQNEGFKNNVKQNLNRNIMNV